MMARDTQFLPWQRAQAHEWLAQRQRFAHAWLVHGPAGNGQRRFIEAGAASLLCEARHDGPACGQCQACRWVMEGNHPDLRRIRPDALALQEGDETAASDRKQPSREIRIDQIRDLLPWFNMATHRGGLRVALLYPAESLNLIAANALLKILEEPPEHTVFLLASAAPDRLLPTLVSRCRRLLLARPGRNQALAWLEAQRIEGAADHLAAAGGAPVQALERARAGQPAIEPCVTAFLQLLATSGPPAALADLLLKSEVADWVDALQRLWLDLSLAACHVPPRYYPALSAQIAALGPTLDRRALSSGAQWLSEQRQRGRTPLNARLLCDHAAQWLLQAARPVTKS